MMRRSLVILMALTWLTTGCGSYRVARQAESAARVENWDAAVYYYLEAVAKQPENVQLRMSLQKARQRAGEDHFRKGLRFKEVGELLRARTELELAVQLDPTHQYAEVELSKVRKDLVILEQEGGASKLAEMKKAASEMKVKPPALNPTSDEPITLSFPNPTNTKDIYKAVGQAFGINILFDSKLKDNKITLELKNVTGRQALETVMQSAGHFYKVLDDKSIIVVEDTPQNRRDYEDLVVKTFFLSSGDVKEVNNMLRALIDARRLAINENLNSIVIRDTADKVAIAERLINANDKAKAEVLVDVELIQVDSTKAREIGLELTASSIPLTLDTTKLTGAATTTRIPLDKLGDISRSMWGVVLPNVTINLIKSASQAETLAQPQLRITEGEKGNLTIGDRVPIPSTTFNTTSTVGGNIVPITAFQYQDVGIKIELEPRVHHNNEVTLKLKVEVSEISGKVTIGGQEQPVIGTRTIDSKIRLKDGETSMLAGLLKYNRTEAQSGVPWLMELPVLGGLFRNNGLDYKKTDLVLTITPHIIRNPDITEEDLAPLWVGTENRITIFGNSPRVRSSAAGSPFGDAGGAEPADEPPPQDQPEELPGQDEPAPPRPRLTFPPQPGEKGDRPPVGIRVRRPSDTESQSKSSESGGTTSGTDTAGAMGAAVEPGLAQVSMYPARLPVLLGSAGTLQVMFDPGAMAVEGPLHFAYDPARLSVVEIQNGELPVGNGSGKVTVSHTPALGWITASWQGEAQRSGTLFTLTVRPLTPGEHAFIFAGPLGELVARPATVVGLPTGAVRIAEEEGKATQ